MSVLRVALLGCGRIVRHAHLRVLQARSAVRLVAVAEPTAAGQAFAARHAPGCRQFDDFRALLAEPSLELDAVVVALPTLLHREAALAAASRGVHLYLEKPIAASLDDGRAIVEAWRDSPRVAMMGFNCRAHKLYRALKDAVTQGQIGRPLAVRMAWAANWPTEATWRLSPQSGGGGLLELASHQVDLLRYLFDTEITSVMATTWSNRGPDEAAMLHLTLDAGPMAQLFVSYDTAEEDRVEVYGSDGKLMVDRYDSLIVARRSLRASGGLSSAVRRLVAEASGVGYGLEKRRAPGQEPSYATALGAFLEAARDGHRRHPDLFDGYRALEVIDAARRAARDGRRVDVAPWTPGASGRAGPPVAGVATE